MKNNFRNNFGSFLLSFDKNLTGEHIDMYIIKYIKKYIIKYIKIYIFIEFI